MLCYFDCFCLCLFTFIVVIAVCWLLGWFVLLDVCLVWLIGCLDLLVCFINSVAYWISSFIVIFVCSWFGLIAYWYDLLRVVDCLFACFLDGGFVIFVVVLMVFWCCCLF